MKITKLNELYFKEFISSEEIQQLVTNLASQVKNDLPVNEVPMFIGILNGCFVFAADFLRAYKGNCEISFVKLASYEGISSSEKEERKLLTLNTIYFQPFVPLKTLKWAREKENKSPFSSSNY